MIVLRGCGTAKLAPPWLLYAAACTWMLRKQADDKLTVNVMIVAATMQGDGYVTTGEAWGKIGNGGGVR